MTSMDWRSAGTWLLPVRRTGRRWDARRRVLLIAYGSAGIGIAPEPVFR